MPMLAIPAPSARQPGVTWAHRAARAAVVAALTASAAAGLLLIHQPSQPSAVSARCAELCSLPAASLLVPA
jgi:hypothetical protein